MSEISRLPEPEMQDELYLHLVEDIEAEAQLGYNEDTLVYHVWQHALNTRATNKKYRDELRATGFPGVPGEFMTAIDSLLHDYNYLKWFELQKMGNNPYGSPEELAVVEGGELLESMGVDKFTIDEWSENIWGTKLGVACNKIGAFTLCAADMSNTGRDYETVMKPDTDSLRVEKGNIEGGNVDPIKFAVGSIVVISGYRFINLRVPKFIEASPMIKEMYDKQGDNLSTMIHETAGMVGAVGEEAVHTFMNNIGGTVSQLWPLNKKAS